MSLKSETAEWMKSMGFEFANASHQECVDWFLSEDKRLRAIKSILPDEPDYQKVNDFLVKTRLATLNKLSYN